MVQRRPLARSVAAGLATILVGGLGCGGVTSEERSGSPSEPPCSPVASEGLDPASSVHLLPGAAEPRYRSDPPTSGPHLSGRAPGGVLMTPIDRPTQVLVLEEGAVLIQHRDLAVDEVAALQSLATPDVVVAPNPELPARVVSTAWLTKLTCSKVDLATLGRFVQDHQGGGLAGEDEPG